MAGKASLLLVMGFSMILLVFGNRLNRLSTDTVDNFTNYYSENMTHNLAVSGANLAANKIFMNTNWDAGFKNLKMNGGTLDVRVDVIDAARNIRKLTSVSTYEDNSDTVEVILTPNSFARFAYYSQYEGSGIWWTNRDTVFGPFHTEDNLRCDNHPVFGVGGYETTIRGRVEYHDHESSDKPVFHGSFHDGYPDPLNSNGLQPLREAAVDDGHKIEQSTSTTTTKENRWVPSHWERIHGRWVKVPGYFEEVITTTTAVDTAYVTFVNDSVRIKLGYDKPSTTFKTSELAPNGVIYSEGMDVRLQGTVEGQFSVVSDGNVYLDDDILYTHDPKINPSSTDLLGILAQNKVLITDNNATLNIQVDAAIYCQDGGFGAENYSTRSVDGDIHLLGGITQNIRQAVGQYTSDKWGNITIIHGYNKRYRYDTRLGSIYPPFYPICGGFQIVSWKE
jgi:hypothetical protein